MTLRRLLFALAACLLIAVGVNGYVGIDNYRHLSVIIEQTRREGCEAAERLRTQNRANVAEEQRNLKRNLARLPGFNTPAIVKLSKERFARDLAQNARVDCNAYSERVGE